LPVSVDVLVKVVLHGGGSGWEVAMMVRWRGRWIAGKLANR
jgi:hypothetical protein